MSDRGKRKRKDRPRSRKPKKDPLEGRWVDWDWDEAASPQSQVDAWNARFVPGQEVAVAFITADMWYLTRTYGPAFVKNFNGNEYAAIPVENMSGEPEAIKVWPVIPGTEAWHRPGSSNDPAVP